MWGRKKASEAAAADQAPEPVVVAGPRADGPFDVAEREFVAEEYLDLGAVLVKARPDIEVQLPTEDDVVQAVLVAAEGSAIELRPFAGAKNGGTWNDVRAELQAEVERRGGQWTDVEGPFGHELLAQFPATAPDGTEAVQPARFIGVEGPRWVLRATVLGAAGLESTAEGVLMDVLRDVRVRRGAEPRILRESLPLVIPAGAQLQPDVEA